MPKLQYIEGAKSGSDTEHPPPPSSPSKFANRARIKAVPRLAQQRRTSFTIGSASESEDESKRSYNRIRNDSVCSAASGTFDLQGFDATGTRKEFSSVIQRKCRRTEQSRKLAEARREFSIKYNKGDIDRQKLTMLDLIFYNPATSPMSQKKKRRLDTETESLPPDRTDLEVIDDPLSEVKPLAAQEEPPSDEENTVPAPQITIGANGEIIVDEKSLIIENKETTKNREALKQSQIVDGDFDSGYGVYKRVKRSRDWSKEETLRFYKALNTIGTDFTMMGELFPDRNRKELKMKFKKEERVNRGLIDRAVMQPIQFDMTDLRKEVEMAKLEKEEAERCRKEKEDYKQCLTKKRRGRRDIYDLDEDDYKIERKLKKPKKPSNRQKILKSGINSLCDSDSDNSVSTLASRRSNTKQSDSEDDDEEEHIGKVQTTRSGRISKPKIINEASGKIEDDKEETSEKLTPGSLMILTETDENNETVHKIYTVDEDGKKVPIDLTPDILANLTQENNSDDETTMPGDTTDDKIIDNNLTSLNCTDIIIGDDSMIIPFDEYDEQMMHDAETADQIIQVVD